VLPAMEPVEVGDSVHAEQYGFAIEDELLRSNATGRLNDQRITCGPVIALRVKSRTRSASRETISRKPSCFTS
jgi:hypothetical protein